MRLVASTPGSKTVPASVRRPLDAVSPDALKALVERIAVPRVYAGITRLLVHVVLEGLGSR